MENYRMGCSGNRPYNRTCGMNMPQPSNRNMNSSECSVRNTTGCICTIPGVKGKKHDSHQMLYRLNDTPYTKPKTASIGASNSDSKPKEISLQIKKRDADAGALLSGATFLFYCDGVYVDKATTGDDGVAGAAGYQCFLCNCV